MRLILKTLALNILLLSPASAQQIQDPLLDHMTGKWVLKGTIACAGPKLPPFRSKVATLPDQSCHPCKAV